MNKTNPLAGLIGNYGDSDDSEDDMVYTSEIVASKKSNVEATATQIVTSNVAGIHPAPVPHCPWSACYDESSGFTYYWNQKTNAVTWEAPPEYLLALKIAQQHLHSSGTTEVSAEEWQLYQQALAEKQNLHNKVIAKAAITKVTKKIDKPAPKDKKFKSNKKRPASDDEDEKIELITSYHNSDSESNDETVSPAKVQLPATVKPVKVPKNQIKKQKTKTQIVEYGPSMPPNMNYTVPIGPELPPKTITEVAVPSPKSPEVKVEKIIPQTNEKEEKKAVCNDDDSQDESLLLKKLKDKAKLLAKLGGELPSELQHMIGDGTNSLTASPKSLEETKKNIDIDDLLEEIEKTEFSKTKKPETKLNVDSEINSPRSDGSKTPPLEELKTLFPSSKNITEDSVQCLFPSAANVEESSNSKPASPKCKPTEKKENMYLMDINEPIENVSRKKLRISNSVLPERKIDKADTPAYTTKYSQYIDGFSDQRTGLGFKEEEKCDSPKNTISYGNGLTFTKGETLNEGGNKDESIEDMTDLIEAKLKYLNELQPCVVTPVQEMLIQLQTLAACARAGAVCARYVRDWVRGAGAALARHEADAAPPGWTCTFQRSERRYRYRREADGLQQWEYPALDYTDMDISTTPPHQPVDTKQEEVAEPPLPAADTPPAAPPPPRVVTPPPPKWPEPPPPGCDDSPPSSLKDAKKEIGDELMSFYNDIAELEKQSGPNTASSSPEPPESKDKAKDRDMKTSKKKPKVKISSSIGLKHKSVSNLVAKWQQVADEINSD